MVKVPLGLQAYKRVAAGEPEIQLVNRFVEKDPSNLQEHTALLARCGTKELTALGAGPIRGNYSTLGSFGGDLFMVSGSSLYRYDGTNLTQITGTINGTGHPYVTWMKGIGYEYLFIADGLLLQYYAGGTVATGTLTVTGTITNQVVEIGGTYYTWNANVDADASADGSATHPWIALLGATNADSLNNLAKLIDFNGVQGTDFSSTLGGPSTEVTAPTTTITGSTLTVSSISVYAAANTITTSIYSGTGLAWGGATLTGGGVHALQGVAMPDGQAPKALANVSSYVLVSIADSQKFYWINPGEVVIDALNYAEKESHPDNILDMLTAGDQVLIMGDGSTENWYATGDFNAPFAPVEGRVYMRGVVEGTACVIKDSVVLVGNDGQVYEIGYQFGTTAQWGVHRVSTHGIEERIRTQLRSEQGLT